MIRTCLSNVTGRLRRFAKREDGVASLEFVLYYPIFFFILLWSIETSFWMMRVTLLERGLDLAVREIRIANSNAIPTYTELKTIICDNAALWTETCEDDLKLELQAVDPRSYAGLPADADCVDRSEPIQPALNFTPGVANELMLMRACARVEPIFPQTTLGRAMSRQTDGGVALVALTTFVQEP